MSSVSHLSNQLSSQLLTVSYKISYRVSYSLLIEYDHCSPSPCQNEAQCFNTQTDYYCHCSREWQGKNCSISKYQSNKDVCERSKCLNGGTCIDTTTGTSCTCDVRFRGSHCEERVDLCESTPCHNGGRCHSGDDWFLCECAPGFIGPDCRINVNECSSNPCYDGSTCVDDIASFRCICAPNRTGFTCHLDTSVAYNKGSCKRNDEYVANGTEWNDSCNKCHCKDGKVSCTDIWCGLPNCFDENYKCDHNQVCVALPEEACLYGQCEDWGECREVLGAKMIGPPLYPSPPYCWPNRPATLTSSCAILILNYTPSLLPVGVNTEIFCRELRALLLNISSHHQNAIILCDLKDGTNNSLEITLWIGEQNYEIKEFTRLLSEEILNKKMHRYDKLRSINNVSIRIAQAITNQGRGYYIAGSISGLVAVVLIFSILLLYKEKFAPLTSNRIHQDIEISNNKQNEDNIKCYTNPLKEDWKCKELSLQVGGLPPAASASSSICPSLEQTCEDKGQNKVLQKVQNSGVEPNQNNGVDCKRINFDKGAGVQRTLISTKDSTETITMYV